MEEPRKKSNRNHVKNLDWTQLSTHWGENEAQTKQCWYMNLFLGLVHKPKSLLDHQGKNEISVLMELNMK